jgi:FkbM family methyltransferase
VEVITFTDLIKKIGNLDAINIIKIDIEGGEFKIIKDVYNLLKTKKIIVLISYHPFHIGLKNGGYLEF